MFDLPAQKKTAVSNASQHMGKPLFFKPQIQPKLTINDPDDLHEREANVVAERVMRSSGNGANEPFFKPAISPLQRKAACCQASNIPEASGGTENILQRKEEEEVQRALQSTGQPMDRSTRTFMEQRLGNNFSDVQIHNDALANRSAADINALAYTHGNHVVFGSGQYKPETNSGKQLLAHELVHTLQQKGSGPGMIQRAMKFEFQITGAPGTSDAANYVFAVKNKDPKKSVGSYKPDPLLLPRKYAPDTKGYKHGDERGSMPAYLSVGKHGVQKGDSYFEEPEGPLVMEEAKKGIDTRHPAQLVRKYQFHTQVDIKDLIGNPVTRYPFKLLDQRDNGSKHNPNTSEDIYINADGKKLSIHVDGNQLFKAGHLKYMKVGRKRRKDIDKTREAQFIETWKIKYDSKGPYTLFGFGAKLEQVGKTVDNASIKGKKYNAGTYEKSYYFERDLDGDKPKKGSRPLDIHLDKDGVIKFGHVKYMEKKTLGKGQEQTAIELQSEEGGVLEFETPKWFNDWSELRLRIQDAFKITRAINASQKLDPSNAEDKVILDAMKAKGRKGEFVEWPPGYSTSHLKNLRKDNRRLLIEINDRKWHANIQFSEQIPLSKYQTFLKAYSKDPGMVTLTLANADTVLQKGYDEAKLAKPADLAFKDKGKKKTLDLKGISLAHLVNLKSFLQIIVEYITKGQLHSSRSIAKDLEGLMSRTSFYSIYHGLLNETERMLFQYMVRENTITEELETPLNDLLSKRSTPSSIESNFATGRTYLFRSGHKAGHGPRIKEWLDSIIHGVELKGRVTDKLSPPHGGSAAMGAHDVDTQPGKKDTNLVWFEVRYSNQRRNQPADKWEEFVKERFISASTRVADTPDDPITAGVNEASKTGFKNVP